MPPPPLPLRPPSTPLHSRRHYDVPQSFPLNTYHDFLWDVQTAPLLLLLPQTLAGRSRTGAALKIMRDATQQPHHRCCRFLEQLRDAAGRPTHCCCVKTIPGASATSSPPQLLLPHTITGYVHQITSLLPLPQTNTDAARRGAHCCRLKKIRDALATPPLLLAQKTRDGKQQATPFIAVPAAD